MTDRTTARPPAAPHKDHCQPDNHVSGGTA